MTIQFLLQSGLQQQYQEVPSPEELKRATANAKDSTVIKDTIPDNGKTVDLQKADENARNINNVSLKSDTTIDNDVTRLKDVIKELDQISLETIQKNVKNSTTNIPTIIVPNKTPDIRERQ